MSKRPGVGFTLSAGMQVCTEDSDSRNRRCAAITLSARPFGPDGNAISPDPAELGRRYAGGANNYPATRQPIGLWAETFEINGACLEAWFLEQSLVHRVQWTGVPTTEEKYDLAHSQNRRGSEFYRRYWFSRLPGGAPETAVLVDRSSYPTHAWRFAASHTDQDFLEQRLGLQETRNALGYSQWFFVAWFPGIDAPQSEPPPPQPDPPPSPPDPTPEPVPGRATPRRRAEEWHETLGALIKQAGMPKWAPRLWWLGREPFLLAAEALIVAKRRALDRPEVEP